jgi:hypothetical protein
VTPRELPQVDDNSEEARTVAQDKIEQAIDIMSVVIKRDAKPGWLTKDFPNL